MGLRLRRAPLFAASLLVALAGLGRAASGQGAAPPPWTFVHEVTVSADGETLSFLRLKNPGGVPVILSHGIGSNLYEMHLPSRSFAEFLAARGYDVWCLTFRGTGRNGIASSGRAGASFDDLVAQDLPAAVEKVRAATGERPFLVGHSLGGMVSLAYLQGATRARVPVSKRLSWTRRGLAVVDVTGARMVGDAQLAARRNAGVRGIVALASPARFRWPVSARDASFWRRSYWDYNVLLEYLAWDPAANYGAVTVDKIPGRALSDVITDDLARFPFVGPEVRPFLAAVTAQVGSTYLSAELIAPGSVAKDPLFQALDLAIDDTGVPVLRQFMEGIRTGDLHELHVLDPLRRPYSYADGYSRVTAPALWVGGRFDKLANDDTIQAHLPRLGSADKTYLGTDHGHVDLVIGDAAPADVWTPVEAWLARHR